MKSPYLTVIKRQWKLIVSVAVVAAVLSLVLSVIQKPLYRTSAELLIVPKNYATNDIYASAKAAEHLALTFSEVVYTNTFMSTALGQGAGLSDNFGTTALERKESWSDAIKTKVVSNTGFLRIDTYAPDKQQSAALAYAITGTLEKQAGEYLGQNDSVTVKVIDSPTTYDQIAKPQVGQNVLLGLILGIVAGIGLAFVFPQEHELNLLAAIGNLRPGLARPDQAAIFPDASEPTIGPIEPKEENQETTAPAPEEIPAAKPIAAEVVAPTEKVVVAEDEPVELSHEDRSDYWLKTGEVRQ